MTYKMTGLVAPTSNQSSSTTKVPEEKDSNKEGLKLKNEEDKTTTVNMSSSMSTSNPGGPSNSGDVSSLGTVNLDDFASLLNPKNVENCICCNASLLTNAPPSLFDEDKTGVLQTFCDILNLPVKLFTQNLLNLAERKEEEEVEEEDVIVDFPFCLDCTKHKVKKIIQIYQRLQSIRESFERLKEAIMNDILRVFISNMVFDKKIHLNVVRETKIHDRMLQLFKRHCDKKIRNVQDQEIQTDTQSQSFFPSYPSIPHQKYYGGAKSESPAGYFNHASKRKRGSNRKTEPHRLGKIPYNKKSTSNLLNSQKYPSSNISEAMQVQDANSYDLSSSTNISFTGESTNHDPTNLNENSAYFDNPMNGMIFDDNGFLGLEEDYFNNFGIGSSNRNTKGNANAQINGFTSYEHSSLNDEFHNVLGLMDGLVADVKTSVKVPIKDFLDMDSSSSPTKSYHGSDHQVVVLSDHKVRIRKIPEKINCKICDKLLSKTGYKSHMDLIHKDEKPYKCRGCDKRFARRDHFKEHEDRHLTNTKRSYFCHRCGPDSELIISKSSYANHCVNDHNIEDDVVECFHFCDAKDCNQAYKVREDFLNHVVTHWNIGDHLQCSVCDKSFAERTHLESHEQDAHPVEVPYYDCQFCHMGFDDEEDYSRHLTFHQVKIPEERLYECDFCGKFYETKVRLRSHRYNAHISRNKDKDEKIPGAVVTRRKSNLACKQCGKTYSSKKRLQKHMLKHDEDEDVEGILDDEDDEEAEDENVEEEEPEENETQNDEDSNQKVPEETHDNSEQEQVYRSLFCQYCMKKQKSRFEMRKHLVKVHPDKHMNSGKKHCMVCWYLFKSQDKLQEHYDLKHGRLKCEECARQFSNSLLLKQHMKRHSKELNYICNVCEERFASSSVLKRHITRMHPTTVTIQRKSGRKRKRTAHSRSDSDGEMEDPDDSTNASNNFENE